MTSRRTQMDFSDALREIKAGYAVRRAGWKPGRSVELWEPEPDTPEDELTYSFLALRFKGGGVVPWFPNRCDLLENDWEHGA